MKVYKSLLELAHVLKDEHEASIVTTDPYRRGDIVHQWSLLLNERFRHSRWFGPAHSRIFDKLFLPGEIPTGNPVYYDELLKPKD